MAMPYYFILLYISSILYIGYFWSITTPRSLELSLRSKDVISLSWDYTVRASSLNLSTKRYFTLWYTLCSLTGRRCNQQGQGSAD